MRIGVFLNRDSQHGEDISVEASVKEEVLLTELRRRYELQQAEIETVNTKAGIALAYLGAVFFLLLDTLPNAISKIWVSNNAVIWLSVIAFFAYLASAGCCILAIRPAKGYSPVAAERDEIEYYLALTREEMMLQVLSQYSHFLQKNSKIVQLKNRWLIRALILSLVFTAALVGVKAATMYQP
jgi:hypothetical protein